MRRFIGALTTKGAVSPSRRRPATKVWVIQCPKGALERSRWPFRQRPRRDFDLRNVLAVYPELANIPPGIEIALFYSERVLIDPMRAQHEGLLQVLRDFPADVIIADKNYKYAA